MSERDHFRVMSTMATGRRAIQSPHFASEADAQLYIERNRDVIMPGEKVDIIRDFDDHIYPVWRPNRP